MTRKQSKQKRVGDVLDAAVAEFVDRGYEGASMESIALRAGLTKGGLYYHFKSKDDILVRANERFMEPVMSMMAEASAEKSPAAGLRKYIACYLEYWPTHSRELAFVFLTMTKAIAHEPFRDAFTGCTRPVVEFLQGLYQRGVDSGQFRPLDCRAAALTLMTALDGGIGYLAIDRELTQADAVSAFCYQYVDVFRGGSHEE